MVNNTNKKVSKVAMELYELSKIPPAKPRPNHNFIEVMTEIGHQIECLNEDYNTTIL